MITKAKTKEEMAIDLTKENYTPLPVRELLEYISELERTREQAIMDALYDN